MGSDTEFTSESSCSEAASVQIQKPKSKSDSVKRHKCNYPNCKSAFNRPWKLERHKYIHTDERPFKCAFTSCTKDYRSLAHLRRHVSVSHTEQKNPPVFINCPYPNCHKVFSNKYSLKKHCKSHVNENPYKCTECELAFKKRKKLQEHSYTHTGKYPFMCGKCNKPFTTKTNLIRHERKHKTYICDYEDCDVECDSQSTYRKHVQMLHSEGLVCATCSKAFHNKSNLREHVLSHLPEEDREVLKCTYEDCTRYYFHKRNLDHHIAICHKGVRYPCPEPECGMLLATKDKLKWHILIHTNPKPMNGKKKPEKPRKDKGKPKKSQAALLSGIVLPSDIDKELAQNNVNPYVEEQINNTLNNLLNNVESSEQVEVRLFEK